MIWKKHLKFVRSLALFIKRLGRPLSLSLSAPISSESFLYNDIAANLFAVANFANKTKKKKNGFCDGLGRKNSRRRNQSSSDFKTAFYGVKTAEGNFFNKIFNKPSFYSSQIIFSGRMWVTLKPERSLLLLVRSTPAHTRTHLTPREVRWKKLYREVQN